MLATGRRDLSWIEVIKSGQRYADQHGLGTGPRWSEQVTQLIEMGVESDDMDSLLFAAEKVQKALLGGNANAFSHWVGALFQDLKASDKGVYEALQALRLPILTTNYDTLIESSLGWVPVAQTNPALFQAILSANSPTMVGHLHGVWSEPQSLVLGSSDYARVSSDSGTGALHRAAGVNSSLIYIGFGSGLGDPNFDAVRRWSMAKIGPNFHTHYRLCRDSEVKALRELHSDGSVVPVAYGSDFGDLVPFLQGLAPGGAKDIEVSLTTASEVAYSTLLTRAHEDSVLLASLLANPLGDRVLMPPVMMRVPQQVYSSADPAARAEHRCDAAVESSQLGTTILVGGELSGVSSALTFMLLGGSHRAGSVPLLVNYRKVRTTQKRPIEDLIRREASQIGIIATPSSDLPVIDLAIDDFYFDKKHGARALADLKSLNLGRLVIGCHTNDEKELLAALDGAGMDAATLYLGRLNSGDVGAYARQVDAVRAPQLARKVVRTLTAEHLPSTPYNVLMLLTILIRDEQILAGSTPTLVDQFVALLMSEGLMSSGRQRLDNQDFIDILEFFAAFLASRRRAECRIDDFLEMLLEYMEQVGWAFEGQLVLDRLLATRVLALRENNVRFAHSSYLYLFIARHARADSVFKALLLSDPLFFREVLTYYAALTRNDPEVLEMVKELMAKVPVRVEPGKTFIDDGMVLEVEEETASGEGSESTPTRVEEADQSEGAASASRTEEVASKGDDEKTVPFDALEMADEHELQPLAPNREIDPATFVGSVVIGDYAACVLGYSDAVKDPALKREVLKDLLRVLANIVDACDDDPEFAEFVESLVEQAAADLEHERVEAFREFLHEEFAPLLVLSVVTSRLRTAKLSRTVDSVLTDPEVLADVRRLSVGAIISIVNGTSELKLALSSLVKKNPRAPIVQGLVGRMAMWVYVGTPGQFRDIARIEDFIVDLRMSRLKFTSTSDRGRRRGHLVEKLRKHRKTILSRRGGLSREAAEEQQAVDASLGVGEVVEGKVVE